MNELQIQITKIRIFVICDNMVEGIGDVTCSVNYLLVGMIVGCCADCEVAFNHFRRIERGGENERLGSARGIGCGTVNKVDQEESDDNDESVQCRMGFDGRYREVLKTTIEKIEHTVRAM